MLLEIIFQYRNDDNDVNNTGGVILGRRGGKQRGRCSKGRSGRHR